MATKVEITENMRNAALCYIRREQGREKPQGKTDKGGRWYPSDAEQCDNCNSVYTPSRAFPWSIYKHCFTYDHIANLHGVKRSELIKAVKYLKPSVKFLDMVNIKA